jgi:cytochrome c oxidase cbb3-type subunit 3
MAIGERDSHSGYMTTGHEWNGITELNTPVPRAVYFFLLAAFAFSVGCWLLLPTWPLGASYTRGLLGIDQRTTLEQSLKKAEADRAPWTRRIEAESFAAIRADAALMDAVRQTGRTLFMDNCAACHGTNAAGGKGFPGLTTKSWLWGGSPEAISETIRVGVNSTHPDSRVSQMLAFGRDQILSHADIQTVVGYVQSLSSTNHQLSPEKLAAGRAIYIANCASCHGENGRGKIDMGAPTLTGPTWVYGGNAEAIYDSVWSGRQGHMPAWQDRLTAAQRKILTLYIATLESRDP